jgi:hypothetical protein
MVHEAAIAVAVGKVNSRNPTARSPEESDGNVVPEKLANKGSTSPAESMEGRAPTERKSATAARLRSLNRLVLLIGSR